MRPGSQSINLQGMEDGDEPQSQAGGSIENQSFSWHLMHFNHEIYEIEIGKSEFRLFLLKKSKGIFCSPNILWGADAVER